MIIEKIEVNIYEPQSKNVLWVDANTNIAKVFLNGKWVPLSAAAGDAVTDVVFNGESVVNDGVATIDGTTITITVNGSDYEIE